MIKSKEDAAVIQRLRSSNDFNNFVGMLERELDEQIHSYIYCKDEDRAIRQGSCRVLTGILKEIKGA